MLEPILAEQRRSSTAPITKCLLQPLVKMNADFRSRIPAIVDNDRSGGSGDKSDTQAGLLDVGRIEQEATVAGLVAANKTGQRDDNNTDIKQQQQPAKHHHRNQHRHSSHRHHRQSLTEQQLAAQQQHQQQQQQQHYQAYSSSCHQDRASANQLSKPLVSAASITSSPCSTNTTAAETAQATTKITTTTTTTNDQERDEQLRSCSQLEILATHHQSHQEDSAVVVVATSNQGDQSNHLANQTTTPTNSSPPLSSCSRCAANRSVSSGVGCSTAIAPTSYNNNHNKTTSYATISNDQQDTASEHSNNSFLFWKFISNLPKSITQRSKSNSSNTLTPEVAGYLANKRQCNINSGETDHCATAASMTATTAATTATTTTTTTTTTSSNLDRDESSEGYHQHQNLQRHNQFYEDDSSETNAKRAPQLARNNMTVASKTSDLAAGKCVAAQQLSQDGQRLIKIIAPPKLPSQQHVAAAPTGVVCLDEATAAAAAQNKAQQQIKLSIATITTTTATNTRSSASSLSSCILSESATSEVRLKWGKKMDFLLSIIGFAVDLANIWRFPYLVYKNGGGVFLIPYVTMLIFGGIPLFFLELCLGQFVKKGPITVWNKICPSMKGVGYCSILISWYVSFYYNVLIAWSVYFIYRSLLSFGEKMPWEDCDNSWNSKGTCVSISQLKNLCSTRNESLEACRKDMFAAVNVTSPASEFFVKELSQIDQSTGLDDMGYLRPELVLCTMIVYLLHYFSLFRGLETSGKVVWVTATAPYMILSILLIRGLFLPGASMGIEYYLSPKLEKLADPTVWIDAAGQVFYSIGVGFGVHLTYASFNSHNNNCYRDCLMTSAVNAATSVYSGLVVFVYLGYMAKNLGIEIDKVASEGYSLVFEVYPEALTTLPFARFWSILFFIMLLTLGIDSAVSSSSFAQLNTIH